MGNMIATLVKQHPQRANNPATTYGPAALYALSAPYAYGWDREKTCSHMFVSSSVVCGAPETYAFAADETGDVLSWTELDGSEKGETTHAKVLANMGYDLAEPVDTSSTGQEKP